MKRNIFKCIVSILLIAVLVLPVAAAAATGGAAKTDEPAATGITASGEGSHGSAVVDAKNEVVYAVLEADGTVRNVYAVNHFEVSGEGSVTDYGAYASVLNLTNTQPIVSDGGKVTFDAGEGNYYYQGNLQSTALPWNVGISYALDGVQLTPAELSGKSGQLEIHIKTTKNESVDATFYENYMLQISLTLSNELCSNIDAPEATIAAAGQNKMLAYTVMPGTDADYTLKADVRDFTMAGIDVSGVPFSMSVELPDTDEMIGEFETLSDAITALDDGIGQLSDGVASLGEGTGKLTSGSAAIRDGLSQLKGNAGQLTSGSAQIKQALAAMSGGLSSGGLEDVDLSSVALLPSTLRTLADQLDGMAGGLGELKEGYNTANGTLSQLIALLPQTALTPDEITALYAATDESQHATLDVLIQAYNNGLAVRAAYSGSQAAFGAVGTTLEGTVDGLRLLSGTLRAMAAGIEDALSDLDGLGELTQLMDGLTELSAQYDAFHSGLLAYTGGVGTLADQYAVFHSGIAGLDSGVGDMGTGASTLHEGSSQLDGEVSKLPEAMQQQIDSMLSQYTGADFDPVSFVSQKNENIGIVQFVFKCDGVAAIEDAETGAVDAAEPESQMNLWQRLVALFKGEE